MGLGHFNYFLAASTRKISIRRQTTWKDVVYRVLVSADDNLDTILFLVIFCPPSSSLSLAITVLLRKMITHKCISVAVVAQILAERIGAETDIVKH